MSTYTEEMRKYVGQRVPGVTAKLARRVNHCMESSYLLLNICFPNGELIDHWFFEEGEGIGCVQWPDGVACSGKEIRFTAVVDKYVTDELLRDGGDGVGIAGIEDAEVEVDGTWLPMSEAAQEIRWKEGEGLDQKIIELSCGRVGVWTDDRPGTGVRLSASDSAFPGVSCWVNGRGRRPGESVVLIAYDEATRTWSWDRTPQSKRHREQLRRDQEKLRERKKRLRIFDNYFSLKTERGRTKAAQANPWLLEAVKSKKAVGAMLEEFEPYGRPPLRLWHRNLDEEAVKLMESSSSLHTWQLFELPDGIRAVRVRTKGLYYDKEVFYRRIGKVIHLLHAIRQAIRAAHFWRDMAQTKCQAEDYESLRDATREKERLYALAERGIAAAWKQGLLKYVGASPLSMGVYMSPEGKSIFHSCLHPLDATRHRVDLSEVLEGFEGRVRDAEHTLSALPEPGAEFDRVTPPKLKPPVMCFQCGREGHVARKCPSADAEDCWKIRCGARQEGFVSERKTLSQGD